MLAPTIALEQIDFFAHIERPGAEYAKDIYALVNENFSAIAEAEKGFITSTELSEYAGNEKLKNFLTANADYLSRLSFSANNFADVVRDALSGNTHNCCISFADLNTFSWLAREVNRRIFYEGNFQSIREGAGMQAAGIFFVAGIALGWLALCLGFSSLNVLLAPAEAIAYGVMTTVGIPILSAMTGYMFGTRQADRYFMSRIEKIDRVLNYLESR